MSEQTVRELRASIRVLQGIDMPRLEKWAAIVDEMITAMGHDRWLDMDVTDFKRIEESKDVVALLQLWGEMAATRVQIASLPECTG